MRDQGGGGLVFERGPGCHVAGEGERVVEVPAGGGVEREGQQDGHRGGGGGQAEDEAGAGFEPGEGLRFRVGVQQVELREVEVGLDAVAGVGFVHWD